MPKIKSINPAPTTCRFTKCHYNYIAPSAGSQECIGCEGLKPQIKIKKGKP